MNNFDYLYLKNNLENFKNKSKILFFCFEIIKLF